MRRLVTALAVGAVALAGLAGCGNSALDPQPGDTVTPVFNPPRWKPGGPADLTVRLQAKGKDGTVRLLGFGRIDKDPVANIVFYEGSDELRSVQVTLSHRC